MIFQAFGRAAGPNHQGCGSLTRSTAASLIAMAAACHAQSHVSPGTRLPAETASDAAHVVPVAAAVNDDAASRDAGVDASPAEQRPSKGAIRMFSRCRGSSLHPREGFEDPAVVLDNTIVKYAMQAFGAPRTCQVGWNQYDGLWRPDIDMRFGKAEVRVTQGYETHDVDLVATTALPDPKAAREALANVEKCEEERFDPDHSAPTRTETHGDVRWVYYGDPPDEPGCSWALGYRGTRLVGLKFQSGS